MNKSLKNYIRFYAFAALVITLATASLFLVRDGVYDVDMCIVRFLLAFIVIFGGHYLFFIKGYRIPVKKIFWWIACILCALVFCAVVTAVGVRLHLLPGFTFPIFVFCFGTMLLLALLIAWLKYRISDILLFSLILFIVGTVYASSYPATTRISWDDQIHYKRAVIVSHANLNNALLSDADNLLINSAYMRWEGNLPDDELRAFSERVDETYLKGGKYREACDKLAYGQILTYLPSSLVLLVGRGLCLPYSVTFAVGRWANTFLYVFLVFLALRRVKSGKIIFFVISMFPSTLLLMSNYSYDTWGLGFTILAFALWLEVMQKEEVKMTYKRLITICLLFALSCAAKPIYFPMILVFLLMPRSELDESLSLRSYRMIIILTAFLLASSFVIPYMLTGAGSDDARGGSDVNSSEQIRWIALHPLTYVGVLLRFLRSYWSSGLYVRSLAYLGDASYDKVVYLPMLVFCFMDRSNDDCTIVCLKNSVVTWFLAFTTSAIVATIMYVSFTPVGSNTINGCQPRYILPLLPFVAYFFMGCRVAEAVKRVIDRKWVATVTVLYMAVYTMGAIYNNCLAVF